MKLKTKIRISYIALVALIVFGTTIFLHVSTNLAFKDFINKQGETRPFVQERTDLLPFNNPRNLLRPSDFDPKTPERLFLESTNKSLFFIAIFSLILAILFSEIIANSFLSRFEGLYVSMKNYQKNGKLIKIDKKSDDEIYELEKVYNDLVSEIKRQEDVRKEFFIDMSHELKTPIATIIGYLQGLQDKVFKPTKEFIDKPLSEANRMDALISEMMNLAKMEAGDSELKKVKTDLRGFIKIVISDLQYLATSKNMKIEIQGNAEVLIDQNKFKQLLVNLINNAINYGDKDSIIKIEILKKDNFVNLIIANKVFNFDKKNLKYIFERFYRGDKSRVKTKIPHLGIGLSIVKKIVDAHGANISADYKNGWISFCIGLG